MRDLNTKIGQQQIVNDLIDHGILPLTSHIREAMEARENANRIAGNLEEAGRASRIAQIYRDAEKRIKII